MTGPLKSTWVFTRHPLSFGNNRVSTDALNVLHGWAAQGPGRSFDVIEGLEDDDRMVAQMTLNTSDQTAGTHLDEQCFKHGVVRATQ